MKGLHIWQDTNADGITQKGELKNLSDFRITSLDARVKDASDLSADFTKGRAWNVKIRDLNETKNGVPPGQAAGKGVDFEIGVTKVREENLSVELVRKATLSSGKGTTVSDACRVKGTKSVGMAATLRTDTGGQEVFAVDLDGDGHGSTSGVDIKKTTSGRGRYRRTVQTAVDGILLDQIDTRGRVTGKKVSLSMAAGKDAYLAIDRDDRRITRSDEIVGLKSVAPTRNSGPRQEQGRRPDRTASSNLPLEPSRAAAPPPSRNLVAQGRGSRRRSGRRQSGAGGGRS